MVVAPWTNMAGSLSRGFRIGKEAELLGPAGYQRNISARLRLNIKVKHRRLGLGNEVRRSSTNSNESTLRVVSLRSIPDRLVDFLDVPERCLRLLKILPPHQLIRRRNLERGVGNELFKVHAHGLRCT